ALLLHLEEGLHPRARAPEVGSSGFEGQVAFTDAKTQRLESLLGVGLFRGADRLVGPELFDDVRADLLAFTMLGEERGQLGLLGDELIAPLRHLGLPPLE